MQKYIPILQNGFRNGINISLLAGLLFLSACLDPIDLDIPLGFEETFVFQATLTKGQPSTFQLTSTRLFDFTPEGVRRVTLRSVFLEDENGQSMEIEADGQGVYNYTFNADDPVQIEAGKSYKLLVSTFDNRRYETNLEPLLPVPEIDTLTYELINKEVIIQEEDIRFDSVVRFYVNTPLVAANTKEPIDIRWKTRRIFQITDSPIEFGKFQKTCYVTEEVDVTQVQIFNGASSSAGQLSQYSIYDQTFSFHLAEGFVFELIQQSLSPGAYNYWDQISQVLERDGDMFEAPAGKIRSNFVNPDNPDDEVFGYFFATEETVARIYVPPVSSSITNLCPPPNLIRENGTCGVAICCDCLSAEISTIIKPNFWGE
jgi:hypothetical protein